jgi:hypothetical protein
MDFNFTAFFSDVALFSEMLTSHTEIYFFIHIHEIPLSTSRGALSHPGPLLTQTPLMSNT